MRKLQRRRGPRCSRSLLFFSLNHWDRQDDQLGQQKDSAAPLDVFSDGLEPSGCSLFGMVANVVCQPISGFAIGTFVRVRLEE